MKGNVKKCVEDLAKRLLSVSSKNLDRAESLMVEFLDVSPVVLGGWLQGKHFPNGRNLLRLQSLLGICGYELLEMKNFSPLALRICELIGFGIATPEEISEVMGLQVDSVLRISKGGHQASAAKEEALKNFAFKKQDHLERAKKRWLENFSTIPGLIVTQSVTPMKYQLEDVVGDKSDAGLPVSANLSVPNLFKDSVLSTLAMQVITILPLAKMLASDDFTPAERELLRKMTGKTGIFDLKNCLVQLCGERARELAISEEGM